MQIEQPFCIRGKPKLCTILDSGIKKPHLGSCVRPVFHVAAIVVLEWPRLKVFKIVQTADSWRANLNTKESTY